MRALIGVPFRLHGRDLRGLDCIGVVAWVHALAVPTGYRLRTADVARVEDALRGLGFVPSPNMAPGNIVVLRPGGEQIHLGIVTGGGFVHADAGLGRVVESPWRDDWAVRGFWRRAMPTPAQPSAESPMTGTTTPRVVENLPGAGSTLSSQAGGES